MILFLLFKLSSIIFPSFLGSSRNSRENSYRTLLVTYFRELQKVPVLVSNFGNQKNVDISKYKGNSRREKERKKERKNARTQDRTQERTKERTNECKKEGKALKERKNKIKKRTNKRTERQTDK